MNKREILFYTLFRKSNEIGGRFSVLFWPSCKGLRNSIFFLLAKKYICELQSTINVSVNS